MRIRRREVDNCKAGPVDGHSFEVFTRPSLEGLVCGAGTALHWSGMSLDALLRPRSVAVVGASERGGHGHAVLRGLVESGYQGQLHPINPSYTEVMGLPCFPDVATAGAPDCLVVAVRNDLAVRVLREAAELGTRAAVILSSGFSEVGGAGTVLADELAALGSEYGLAVCGPNCMGLINYGDAVHLFAESVPPQPVGRPANVAVVAQSGSIARLFLHSERLACRVIVSSGNQTVTSVSDYLSHFAADSAIDVVALFIEALPDADAFFAAAAAAADAGTHVVAVRSGRTSASANAVIAHTGALAGDYRAFEARSADSGITLCASLDELLEATVLLSGVGRLRSGNGIALINSSGGENAHFLDLAAESGLHLAGLTEATFDVLRTCLPAYGEIGNPLDVTGTLLYDPEKYARAVDALVDDPGVDLLAMVPELPWPDIAEGRRYEFRHTWQACLAAARRAGVPLIVIAPVAANIDQALLDELHADEAVVLQGFAPAVQALARLQGRAALTARVASARTDRDDAVALAATLPATSWSELAVLADGRPTIPERESIALLAAAGLPVLRTIAAATPADAVVAAREFGGPVVIKIDSPDIAHKTEVGGVKVGVHGDAEVADVVSAMLAAVRAAEPDAHVRGVLVQPLAPTGHELLLGATVAPDAGPLVVLGWGGVNAELMPGSVARIAPFTVATARMLIDSLTAVALLHGHRGRPPADVDALAATLARFAWFVHRHAEVLAAVDINPLVVAPAGGGVHLLDALLVLRTT